MQGLRASEVEANVMRYRILVELRASRVVDLDADDAETALERAEDAAFPGRHRRDKVKSLVVTGYPQRSRGKRKSKPTVGVPPR